MVLGLIEPVLIRLLRNSVISASLLSSNAVMVNDVLAKRIAHMGEHNIVVNKV